MNVFRSNQPYIYNEASMQACTHRIGFNDGLPSAPMDVAP